MHSGRGLPLVGLQARGGPQVALSHLHQVGGTPSPSSGNREAMGRVFCVSGMSLLGASRWGHTPSHVRPLRGPPTSHRAVCPTSGRLSTSETAGHEAKCAQPRLPKVEPGQPQPVPNSASARRGRSLSGPLGTLSAEPLLGAAVLTQGAPCHFVGVSLALWVWSPRPAGLGGGNAARGWSYPEDAPCGQCSTPALLGHQFLKLNQG